VKLLNEIIDAATDPKISVAATLRKCLILSFELKNDKLKTWVEAELNGYERGGEIPGYRKLHLHAKGNFQGPFGAWIPSRPLPMAVLEERHRKYLDPAILSEPIASYEESVAKSDSEGEFIMNWSPDLIARYQRKFMDGYALSQAWQELPSGAIIAVVDSVRNRLLRFALELRDELGLVGDEPKKVSAEKVDQAVTNYIFGGTNIIAGTAKDFTQVGSIHIAKGDLGAFVDALRTLGIDQKHIEEATTALLIDGAPKGKQLGTTVGEWLTSIGGKLGDAGLKIGTGAVKELITQWMLQYWGLN
jgi:hypothetical protein